MTFSEQQLRLWHTMISIIEDFRKGESQYCDLVYELEGALDAGNFKDMKRVFVTHEKFPRGQPAQEQESTRKKCCLNY